MGMFSIVCFNRTIQLQQPWIDAYSDLQANIQTFSSLMVLSDLNADSDYKLIIVDLGDGTTHVKLKVIILICLRFLHKN